MSTNGRLSLRWFESVYRPENRTKVRKCIYKILKNFRVEKSGESSPPIAGYSNPQADSKIRAPCALQASLQIFGRRMRTYIPRPRGIGSSPRLPQPTQRARHRRALCVVRVGRFATTELWSFLLADLDASLTIFGYGYPLVMIGGESIRYLPVFQTPCLQRNLCSKKLG